MKKLRVYCMLLLSLATLTVGAQHLPFVEEGKSWMMEFIYGPMIDIHSKLEALTMEGDTIIGGRKWKKVYCTGTGVRQLATAMYEEEGKVYFLPYAGATEGNLIYDFSLKTGDKSTFYYPCEKRCLPSEEEYLRLCDYYKNVLKVVGTEKRVYDGIERTCISLQFFNPEYGYNPTIEWVEGLGNIFSSPLDYISMFQVGSSRYGFIDCRLGNQVLYAQRRRGCSRPFVEEGKTWRLESRTAYDMLYDTDAPSTFQRYVIEGDTLVGKRKFKKLYLIQEETGQKTLLSALYETDDSNAKVYFLQYAGDATGQLLYDFLLGEGDQCSFYNLDYRDYLPTKEEYRSKGVKLSISNTEVIERNGLYLQVFNISDKSADFNPDYYYVEAVGNVMDPFRYIHHLAPGSDATHVVECSVGGEKLYEEKLWKDPAVGIEDVRTEEGKVGAGAVYDLYGRRLNGVPKSGMYIRNGRKYLVR